MILDTQHLNGVCSRTVTTLERTLHNVQRRTNSHYAETKSASKTSTNKRKNTSEPCANFTTATSICAAGDPNTTYSIQFLDHNVPIGAYGTGAANTKSPRGLRRLACVLNVVRGFHSIWITANVCEWQVSSEAVGWHGDKRQCPLKRIAIRTPAIPAHIEHTIQWLAF
jgi:hypothetical protein